MHSTYITAIKPKRDKWEGPFISHICDKIHQLKDIRQLTLGMAYDTFIAETKSFTEKPS